MKVYIAASSAELPRARLWRDRCVAAGIDVVSTWIDVVTKVGEANPRDWRPLTRTAHAGQCLDDVADARRIWVLWPSTRSAALIELGFAFGVGFSDSDIFISGDTKSSIFCALGREYATDEEAFEALVEEARR